MELARYKAVLCEGAAEEAIIDILLDDHCLLFEREELIEEEVLRIRSAKNLKQDIYVKDTTIRFQLFVFLIQEMKGLT